MSIPLLLENVPGIGADPVIFFVGIGVVGRSGFKFDSLPDINSQVSVSEFAHSCKCTSTKKLSASGSLTMTRDPEPRRGYASRHCLEQGRF